MVKAILRAILVHSRNLSSNLYEQMQYITQLNNFCMEFELP